MESSIFQFSARERAGIWMLCFITLAAFLLPNFLEPTPKMPQHLEVMAWEAYDSLYDQQQRLYDSQHHYTAYEKEPRYEAKRAYKSDSFERKSFYRTQSKPSKIDINTADSALWESLPGIGPGFAGRIVKFRTRLGGFVAISQVAETFGLPDSTYQKILPYLVLGKFAVTQLSLNNDSEEVFKAHPYIRWKMAKQLIAYRSQHGPFSSPKDLLKANWMTDSIWQKWNPYLKL